MNLKKVISACTASMLGLSYLCSAFTVAAAEKKENLLILGDASSKGYENSKSIVEIINDKLDVNYTNLSDDAATTEDLLKKVKTNPEVMTQIKNSDSVVISAGTYDYLTGIMSVVGEYTENGDSVEEVRQKMIKDVANSSQKIMDAIAPKYTTAAINNIKATVKEIKAINPNTDVYIVSLYNPFKYDVEKYGVTNDPIIDAVSKTVDETLDTFNNALPGIENVQNIMDTNKAFNRLARKYKNVTGDATDLSIKEQFDLATKILAEITGETPASALSKVLSMIPAYLLPLLPDNFTVSPMTFDLGEATYDIASNAAREVVIDLSLANNFGISAFQGALTIGKDTDNFKLAKVTKGDYAGSWAASKSLGTIQFSADGGHNIEATDKVLGKLTITIPEDIKPGEYEVSLSNSSISVLTTNGQKNYKQTDDGVFKLDAGKIIIVDSSNPDVTTTAVSGPTTDTTTGPDVTGVTTTSGPAATNVTTTVSGPDVTGVTTTVSGPDVTGVTTTVSGPVVTGVTTTSGPAVTGVTTTVSGPVVTGVTTTSGPAVTNVTTTVSGPVVTTTTVTTTLPDLPSNPIKSLKVPEGTKAQDMVSQVPLAQFYYSYDAKEFGLDGLTVEAQSYNEKGEAVSNGKIDITKHVQLVNKTATPKSTFDLANRKLIYAVPLEIKVDKTENGKQYIYVENATDATKNEYFDVTDLKKAFDGVTFKAYIGLRGDIDLNFKTDTRDSSAIIKEYTAVTLSKPTTVPKFTEKYITDNSLTLTADETKTLEQFTAFLGDASVNEKSDHSKGAYQIDTRDSSYVIKYYNQITIASASGKEVDMAAIWNAIENPSK